MELKIEIKGLPGATYPEFFVSATRGLVVASGFLMSMESVAGKKVALTAHHATATWFTNGQSTNGVRVAVFGHN